MKRLTGCEFLILIANVKSGIETTVHLCKHIIFTYVVCIHFVCYLLFFMVIF